MSIGDECLFSIEESGHFLDPGCFRTKHRLLTCRPRWTSSLFRPRRPTSFVGRGVKQTACQSFRLTSRERDLRLRCDPAAAANLLFSKSSLLGCPPVRFLN